MPLRLLNISRQDELVFEEVYCDQSFGPPVFRSSNGQAVKYAILSHRWRHEEVLFRDLDDIEAAKRKQGWTKLQGFADVARGERFEYIWMDTCCIDKTSSTELAEALNSMFDWYKLAEKCFAYLDDVFQQRPPEGISQVVNLSTVHEQYWPTLEKSVWFTRGWTLQELLAPTNLVFYDAEWNIIDRLQQMSSRVSAVTGIDKALLEGTRTLRSYSVAQRFSWASGRQTTRIEDRAYSLFGIMGVNMPILYGEGLQSFQRLQEELLKTFSDLTMFAWQAPRNETRDDARSGALLAESPEYFRGCGRMIPIPSRHRGQTHRIIGGRVQFETLAIDDHTRNLRHAVVCCLDDDPTQVVTLTTAAVDTSDNPSFLVADEAGRLRTCDIYWVARASTLRMLDIWRSKADVYDRGVGAREGLLLCRVLNELKGQPTVEIVKGEPSDEWDSTQQVFRYSENDVSRRSRCLHLRIDGREVIRLNIEYETRSSLFHVKGLYAAFPSSASGFTEFFWPNRLPTPFEKRGWKLWRRYFIVASLHHSEQMLHLKAHALTISTVDLQTGIHNFICSFVRWAFGFVFHLLIFGVAVLPLIGLTAIPSLVSRFQITEVSGRAMQIARNGYFFAMLACIVCWSIVEPAGTVSRYPTRYLWPSAGYSRSLYDRYFVRWRHVYILYVNVTSLVPCITYLIFAPRHYYLLKDRGVFAEGKFTGLRREYTGMVAVIVRTLSCLVILFCPLKIIDWIRILSGLGTAVPFLIAALAGNPYTATRTNEFCYHQNTTLPFFDFYANLSGESPSKVCANFSTEGTALWVLLFLSFWDGFIAMSTAHLGRSQWTIQRTFMFLWKGFRKWKERRSTARQDWQPLTLLAPSESVRDSQHAP